MSVCSVHFSVSVCSVNFVHVYVVFFMSVCSVHFFVSVYCVQFFMSTCCAQFWAVWLIDLRSHLSHDRDLSVAVFLETIGVSLCMTVLLI